MTIDNKNAPTPKERLAPTLQKSKDQAKPRSRDFKDEDWYQSAFARFSVSKAARGDALNRLLPPKKFD
jgi:hypothetical protein